MLDCDECPKPAIDTVPFDACRLLLGKDAKFVFQRLDDANNTFLNASNGIELKTSWDPLPTAIGGTKVSITPFLEDVNFNEQDTVEDGENFDGAANVVAVGPQLVTAIIRNPTPEEMDALETLFCEQGTISFYRLLANGNIGARKLTGTSDHAGIAISRNTFVVKDPSKGGTIADANKLMLQFQLPAGWFRDFEMVTPEAGFNPLADIKP